MANGMMYRYVAYAITILSFYASFVLIFRALIDKIWKCIVLGAIFMVLVNPHGFATIIPHSFW